jgi:Fe-S-cluster containining protein
MPKSPFSPALNTLIDRFEHVRARVERSLHPGKVTCKPGCSWCCYLLVRVYVPEGFSLARTLFRLHLTETARNLVAQSADQVELAARYGYGTLGYDGESAAAEWWGKQIPCALLKEKGCSVYGYRPLTCRAYFTRDPVEKCQTGQAEPVDVQEAHKALLAASQTFVTTVFGRDTIFAPALLLSHAVSCAFATAQGNAHAFDNWVLDRQPEVKTE